MQDTNFRSKVFSTAWSFFRANIFTSFNEALRHSWKQYQNVKKMRSGIVTFSFRKVNGELREAKGTLNPGHISIQTKGTSVSTPYNICKYFDIEKTSFRSYRIENLITT